MRHHCGERGAAPIYRDKGRGYIENQDGASVGHQEGASVGPRKVGVRPRWEGTRKGASGEGTTSNSSALFRCLGTRAAEGAVRMQLRVHHTIICYAYSRCVPLRGDKS